MIMIYRQYNFFYIDNQSQLKLKLASHKKKNKLCIDNLDIPHGRPRQQISLRLYTYLVCLETTRKHEGYIEIEPACKRPMRVQIKSKIIH